MKEFKLNNGVLIPSVGLGTFLLEPLDAENSVREALKMGYRLIDTANCYQNERAAGRGMRSSGVKREEIFLSTKLWPTEYENPNAIQETLERLGTDYIDLLFIHQPTRNWRAGYQQLIKGYQDGKIRSIGISNFEKQMSDVLREFAIKPQVNQVECHPFYPQDELRKLAEKEDVRIMSWYPLGGKGKTSELLDHPIVVNIAKKHHKSPAQVVLRWHIQMGYIVIPGSKNIDHIRENLDIYDFVLDDLDMKEMSALNNGKKRYESNDDNVDSCLNWAPKYEEQ